MEAVLFAAESDTATLSPLISFFIVSVYYVLDYVFRNIWSILADLHYRVLYLSIYGKFIGTFQQ